VLLKITLKIIRFKKRLNYKWLQNLRHGYNLKNKSNRHEKKEKKKRKEKKRKETELGKCIPSAAGQELYLLFSNFKCLVISSKTLINVNNFNCLSNFYTICTTSFLPS
jgi:hypothetical protein